MITPRLALIIILTILTVFLLWRVNLVEDFASSREKASTITAWFQSNPAPTYTKYIKDMKNESNIVEFEDVMGLGRANFTVEKVQEVVG
jgi:hypothetical protein